MNEPVLFRRTASLPSVLSRVEPPYARGPRTLLSIVTLSAVGLSLLLLAAELALTPDKRADFLIRNTFQAPLRARLLGLILVSMAVPALISLAALWLGARGGGVEQTLRRLAALCAPFALAFLLPVLFEVRLAQANPLMYLVLLSAFVVTLRPLAERAFAEARELRMPRFLGRGSRIHGLVSRTAARVSSLPLAFVSVVLAASAYAAFAAFYAIQSHRLIQTTAQDLGVYDNLMFNALEGSPFRAPLLLGPGHKSFLSVHAEFGMLLFLPIYALRPGVETLLTIQAVAIGLSALPLYLTARCFLSRTHSLLLSAAFLLYAPIHGPSFSDFHWLPVAMFFHFWLFYALFSRKNWLLVPVLLALFAMGEDLAIGVALLGAFLIVTGERVRAGWLVMGASVSWFVIDNVVLMPRLGGRVGLPPEFFSGSSANFGSAIVSLLTNPVAALSSLLREVKVQYLLHLLAPLAFLPLRRPVLLLLAIPGALSCLVQTAYWPSSPPAFQAVVHFVPFLFLALVLSLSLFGAEAGGAPRRMAALSAFCVGLVAHSYAFGAVLQREAYQRNVLRVEPSMNADAARRYDRLLRVTGKIPREASVAATDYMAPHVSARRDVYSFHHDFGPVDFIFVSTREIHGENQRRLAAAVAKHGYGVFARNDEFLLWKRGHSSEATQAVVDELSLSGTPTRK